MSKPGFAARKMAQPPASYQPQCPSGSLHGRDRFPICHSSSFLCDNPAARLIPCGHARPPGV